MSGALSQWVRQTPCSAFLPYSKHKVKSRIKEEIKQELRRKSCRKMRGNPTSRENQAREGNPGREYVAVMVSLLLRAVATRQAVPDLFPLSPFLRVLDFLTSFQYSENSSLKYEEPVSALWPPQGPVNLPWLPVVLSHT